LSVAFEKMDRVYSGFANIAKLNRIQRSADFLHFCWAYCLANAAQGEVREEGVFFLFHA